MRPCFLVCLVALAATPCAAAERPNVILVMADDLGIGDISPTNPDCKIRTPNLQRLANEGMTFLDAHTPSSVCTPTRYGLLTGRYNWRSRLARGVLNGRSEHLIPADRPTLGHLMRGAGYHTAMVGKWHLGWDWAKDGGKIDFTKPVKNGPDINGFDQYYAHCGSLDMPPYVWVDTGRITAPPDREEGVTKAQDRYGWYRKGPIGSDFKIDEVLQHLFDKSITHVRQRAAKAKAGEPFLLYLALPAPHTPIVPVPPFKGASGLNPYADFVAQVDHHMGQLLNAVKEAGLEKDTLVIFTSDNGCSPEANFPLLKEKGHDPSAGFRGHKADIYEGGHRVPLIVSWPGHAEGGRKTTALACLTDVYPTLREITGRPREALGGEDGYSLLPVFNGKDSSGRDTLISHSINGNFAIRRGPWKLCLAPGSGGWSEPRNDAARKQGLPPLQLVNLEDDPAERKNLAAEHKDKVAELLTLLDRQVRNGRCTPGEAVPNDREVTFLPEGITLPSEPEGEAPELQVLWTVDTRSDSKGSPAVADLDGDGKPEIVFGTYFNDRHVYAISAADGKVKWKFLSDRGPLDASVAIADVDQDGEPEVLAADSSSGNLFCLSGTGKEEWRLKLPNSTDSPPAVADLDGDGVLEIVVGSMWLGDGKGHVGVYRADNRKLLWQRQVAGCVQSAPCLVDLNGDKVLDVIVTSWRGDRGVHAFSGTDGDPLWKFTTAGTERSVGMYHGPSVSGTGEEQRILISTCDGDVYALSPRGEEIWHTRFPGEYLFAPTTVADVTGDGKEEVMIGGRSHLYVCTASSGKLLWKKPVESSIARGAVVADVNGDGRDDVVFCEGTRLHVLDGEQGRTVHTFETPRRGKGDAYEKIESAPVVADFDGDGSLDVFFVQGRGLYGQGGNLTEGNFGRGYAVRLGGKGPGWTTFRGNLRRTGGVGR